MIGCQDMDHLGINMNCNEIENMKEDNFKLMCKQKVTSKAFEFLQNKKELMKKSST